MCLVKQYTVKCLLQWSYLTQPVGGAQAAARENISMPPVPCNSTYDCNLHILILRILSAKCKQLEIHKMLQDHSMFNTPFTFTHVNSWWAPQSTFSKYHTTLSLTNKNTSYLKLYRSWILFKLQQSSGKSHHHLTFFTLSPTNLAWNWFHLEQNFRPYKTQCVKY